MKAAVIGAGRIGCGLIGEALQAAGHEVVFVARSRELTDHFNRVGGYGVHLLNGSDSREVVVDGVRAVCVADTEGVLQELQDADLVMTCLRPHSLPRAAPLIAAGLQRRSQPTNVVTVENSAGAGPALRELVRARLPAGWPLDRHGFSGALAARVVSRRLGDPAADEPLTFIGDPPGGLLVDRAALRAPLPEFAGLEAVDDYATAVRRKLYTFSAGHAVAAYLGFLKGYTYIHTAVRDPEIRAAVGDAILEGQAGLRSSNGSHRAAAELEPEAIIARFDNAALDDPVVRVARDPQRKLGPTDRLVGAAMLTEQAGIVPERLALAAAAALCFEDQRDPASIGLQVELRRNGVHGVLECISGLDPGNEFGRRVAALWARLSTGRGSDNHLLRLEGLVWAWASNEAGYIASSIGLTA